MKKIFLVIFVIGMVIALGAAISPNGLKSKHAPRRVSGCGYTIIEFGVGVDCNGDTVKLVKSRGFQELASLTDASRLESK